VKHGLLFRRWSDCVFLFFLVLVCEWFMYKEVKAVNKYTLEALLPEQREEAEVSAILFGSLPVAVVT